MTSRAWLLPVALLALSLPSAAAYGEGSAFEVDPPVALDGRADTWLPAGTVSYIGSGTSQLAGFRITADAAHVTFRTVSPTCPVGLPGAPTPCSPNDEAEDETILLRDAEILTTKILSHYKVVATSDRAHADTATFGDEGRILVTTIGGARLDTNSEPLHLGMADDAWTPDASSGPVLEPVYDAEAYSAQVSAGTAAILRATGGFEAFFQGLQITVSGVDQDGNKISKSYDTRMPGSDRDPFKAIIVEVTGGDLQGSSAAPFLGFTRSDQRPVTDVHTRAKLVGATGTLAEDGGDRTLDAEDVTLNGPVSLTLTKIAASGSPRLSFTLADGLQLARLDEEPADEGIPPGALAAAGAAGAGGTGALLALAYFWPRLKYAWTLALLPMYTRIERDAVLEHEKRDELYELIRATPGIHAHEIGTKANIGWGTTVYHLKLLENHGLIVSKKSGRYKRFFVNTGEYTKKKDVYGALRNETAKNVAQYIVDHPGTTQKEMCAALGIQPSLASWHVEKLEGVELVKRVKDGRMVRYFAGPAWADLNVRVNPLGPGADTPAET